MCYKAEMFCDVDCNTRFNANLPCACGFGVFAFIVRSPACANAYSTVEEEAEYIVVGAEIGVTYIGVELEKVHRCTLMAKMGVIVAYCGTNCP